MRRLALAAVVTATLGPAATAAGAETLLAQRRDPAASVTTAESAGTDVRRQGSDELVSSEREMEIGSEMVFVTSRSAMAGVPQLYFTDLGLWRSRVAITPLPRLRIVAAVTLLPKQPATLDEPFWQSAALGVRFNLTGRIAVGIDGRIGVLIAGAGYHGSVGPAVQARRRMNEFISWEGRLGLSATKLWPSQPTDQQFWFAEVAGSGEMQLCWGRCEQRNGATWLGIDVAVPVFHRPAEIDLMDPLALDPRTRLGLVLGSFFSITKLWAMYATLAWVDRGDPAVPATQLPILDGGFDQVQLGLGLIMHWSLESCRPGDYSDPSCRARGTVFQPD